MDSKKIIGVTGKKFHGKDTAGDFFEAKGFIRYSFTTPLKNACRELFGLSDEQLNGKFKEEYDLRWNTTARNILQKFGTEIIRDNLMEIFPEFKYLFNEKDFWVYKFRMWYNCQIAINPDVKVVITDVRYENEVAVIKELGGDILKVEREGIVGLSQSHKSETTIDILSYDHLVKNDSTIEEFHKKISELY